MISSFATLFASLGLCHWWMISQIEKRKVVLIALNCSEGSWMSPSEVAEAYMDGKVIVDFYSI